MLKKDDIFINWSSWSIVGAIVLSNLWFEYGLSSNQIRANNVCNVVLLVVDPSSIHHYIFWSDQCYHRVHMMVEVQWYGNSDELLLSPSAASCFPHDQLLNLLSCPNLDLSVGYCQIKLEPMIFIMLSYSWLIPRAYIIISSGSDQCYHLFT